MNQYKIYACEHYGIFYAVEEPQPNGDIFLIGKFNGTGTQYLFIKNRHDIKL